jgi:hypothetical protein
MQREHAFQYVECDVPEGITLDRWRASRTVPAPRRRLVGLRTLRTSYARAGSSRRRAPADGV